MKNEAENCKSISYLMLIGAGVEVLPVELLL